MGIGTLSSLAFIMGSSLVLLLFLLIGERRTQLQKRLDDLSGKSESDTDAVQEFAERVLPKMGAPLLPKKEGERSRLQARLLHAGLYRRKDLVLFLGVKMLLMVGPALLGFVGGLL